jgi:hypothetical protein
LKTIWFILIVLPLLVQGQDNIVPNGGFENYSNCPWTSAQIVLAHPWVTPTVGSPEYFHGCSQVDHISPPEVVYGHQFPHSGEAFIGMYYFAPGQPEGREYAQAELTQTIYPGVRYKVSFYASLADMSLWAVSSLGAHLSINAIHHDEYWLLDVVPQILNPAGNIITDTANWVLVTDTFTSRTGGGEKFITIGNFNTAATSDTLLYNPTGDHNYNFAYYYIDDVSVIALDSIPSGVEEAEQNQGTYNIYPNPSNGTFTIAHTLHTNQMAHVEVYDLLGQRILTKHFSGSAPLEVDLTGVSSGLYTVRILVDNELKFSEKVSVIRP